MITVSAVIAAWEAIESPDPPPAGRPPRRAVRRRPRSGSSATSSSPSYRIREGNAIGSAALVADGYHARTDGFTSLAVALGAVGVWVGFERADPSSVSASRSRSSRCSRARPGRSTTGSWTRSTPRSSISRVRRAHRTRGTCSQCAQVRWLGHRLVADLDITVPAALPVRDGHSIAEDVRHRLLHAVAHLDDAHVHVDPDDANAHQSAGHHRH